MDQTIITILFLVAYWILQAMANKKRKSRSQPLPEADGPIETGSTSNPSPTLEDALREIRTFLNQGEEEPVPTRADPPVVPERRTVPARPVPEPPRLEPKRREPVTRTPEFHSREDEFEARSRASQFHNLETVSPRRKAAPIAKAKDLRLPPPTASYSKRRRTLIDRLHNHDALREAVLLNEVLGPPRSKRPGPY